MKGCILCKSGFITLAWIRKYHCSTCFVSIISLRSMCTREWALPVLGDTRDSLCGGLVFISLLILSCYFLANSHKKDNMLILLAYKTIMNLFCCLSACLLICQDKSWHVFKQCKVRFMGLGNSYLAFSSSVHLWRHLSKILHAK